MIITISGKLVYVCNCGLENWMFRHKITHSLENEVEMELENVPELV